eukprot:ANDGO_03054.mRNA.1 hypothetical protein
MFFPSEKKSEEGVLPQQQQQQQQQQQRQSSSGQNVASQPLLVGKANVAAAGDHARKNE